MPATPIVIVICGPTATGKTSLALALADRLKAAILSADSRQVYREFDIGTAKPTIAQRQQIPHYLIDICAPTETLTLANYQAQAQQLLAAQTAMPTLLVGGTGLYIKSIVRGLRIPRVAPQPELRSQLQDLGQVFSYQLLQQVDPIAARKIHPHDQVRTLRSLEVYYVTGQPISSQQGEQPPTYPILQIGLDCPIDRLATRIEQRTQQMIAEGFVAEVAQLCDRYGPELPLLNTLGYQEIKAHLAGKTTEAETIAAIALHTRQFAKQQRTWFHADASIQWVDADRTDLLEAVWQQIQQFLAGWG